ncbi:MAG: sigma-54-dependent Fis family transcriptional regulator [Opitutaceae bacterium]|nr:sigma-54-dependent Fis family transcriptional regulator [Opitutaceae bacterium]
MLTGDDLAFAVAIQRVNAANPFLSERIAAERAALGRAFQEDGAEWNTRPPSDDPHPNVAAIAARCEEMVTRLREMWRRAGRATAAERACYEELLGYWLYQTYASRFDGVIKASLEGRGGGGRVDFFQAFKSDVLRFLDVPHLDPSPAWEPAHLFACAFQIRRAFHAIFNSLVGGSAPMARLRAQLWQSIFTHDLHRYRRGLFARMGDFSTLITGPSGTGKELVARALARSRYIAFEAKAGRFARDFSLGFYALNLAALSPTLIESELFGHKRGAFTGALSDRAGWMEECPPTGAVFLDEIGDVDTGIQVKLLRVLQSREFQPLGSTETRRFEGKIVAATNRTLPDEIRAGRFREDFYYRLCSDQLVTPSLREQLNDSPEDLETLLRHIAGRMLDPEETDRFTREAAGWIRRVLGDDYSWPGNFRELEQCVRSLVLRGEYRAAALVRSAPDSDWNALLEPGTLTAEEVLRRYIRHVHGQSGTVETAARRLNLDRRTVQARLDVARQA